MLACFLGDIDKKIIYDICSYVSLLTRYKQNDQDLVNFLWASIKLGNVLGVNTSILFLFYLIQISPVINQFEKIGLINCMMIGTKNKKKKEPSNETYLIFKESISGARLPTCSH